MENKLQKIKDILEGFNIQISAEKLDKFVQFEKILKDYNSHTNLMSANDINLIFEKHITDSLAFCKYINPEEKISLIDIGSGGGFPVIPMAIILDNAKITSVDSTGKKVDFLNLVAKELKLKNFISLNERAEALAFRKTFREKFDFASARAVGNLSQILELCVPYLKIGGKFIAYKASKLNEEIQDASDAFDILGAKVSDIYEYSLELDENYTRNLLLAEKVSYTPMVYPRSFSAIKNKPL